MPFLQNLLKNGVYEIRKLACLALIKFLKVNYYEKKRVEIVKYVNEQFFKSKSYFNRMVYLDFVYYSALYLSQNFLKLNIIPDCFKLASDRVANVRRRLAMIMVAIRKRLDRNDKDNLNKFYETLSNLKKDLDLDVSEVFSYINNKFYIKTQITLKSHIFIYFCLFVLSQPMC